MANQPPRRPPPPSRRGMSEFADVLGDGQNPGGGTGIMALTRDPRVPRPMPAPGSAAARAIATAQAQLQVQSVFDTRQIGSFDFVTSFATQDSADPGEPFGSFQVPQGYTLVVRRVEFDIFPTYNGTGISTSLNISLTYDDQPIPLNTISIYGLIDTYGWDTHQVCEQGHFFGVVWNVGGVPNNSGYDIGWRFIGNLIPTLGRPPRTEVGSMPLQVKGV